jgi:hypothetical protein
LNSTQGLKLARQVLYHFSLLNYFSDMASEVSLLISLPEEVAKMVECRRL